MAKADVVVINHTKGVDTYKNCEFKLNDAGITLFLGKDINGKNIEIFYYKHSVISISTNGAEVTDENLLSIKD